MDHSCGEHEEHHRAIEVADPVDGEGDGREADRTLPSTDSPIGRAAFSGKSGVLSQQVHYGANRTE